MRLATTHTYQTPTVRERVRCGHRVHVGPCASCQQAASDRQAAQLADGVAAGLAWLMRQQETRAWRQHAALIAADAPGRPRRGREPATAPNRRRPHNSNCRGRRGGEGGLPGCGRRAAGWRTDTQEEARGAVAAACSDPGDLVLVGEQHVGNNMY